MPRSPRVPSVIWLLSAIISLPLWTYASAGHRPIASAVVTPDDRAETEKAVADTGTYLKRLEKLGFAGVVLVAKDGAPLFAEGYGLADRERGLRWTPATVSDIGSITKQFTGAAILKLEEDKRLKVTDPVSSYFQDVPADKASITLHQLLTHSSGLTDPEDIGDYDPVPLPEYLRKVFALPLLFSPGTGYNYANANFSLLGAIIEKLSGTSYEAFVRKRLFLPAGMFETGYLLPQWGDGRMAQGYLDGKLWGTILGRPMAVDGPHWALRANGGIHSTVYDMLRWAQALLDGRVLTARSMEKYWAPHVSEGGDTFYGYGWSIATGPGGVKIVTHNGGNGIFFADLAIVPDARMVVFLMTNVIAETRIANSLLGQVGRRFLSGEAYPEIPEVAEVEAASLAALTGTYRWSADPAEGFELTLDGQALTIEAQGRKAFAVLNSVREAEPGRLDKLTELTDKMVSGARKGDFAALFKAYGGRIPVDRLKSRWAEAMAEIEGNGPVVRHEVLGSARTEERDETVVRFHCEKGSADFTYVWDLKEEGRLLGRSGRGLKVRLRLYPSGELDFFTWDGGVRPPKRVHIEPAEGGKLSLTIAGEKAPAAVR